MRRALFAHITKHQPETITFTSDISHESKRILANILAENHPLLEVARLLPDHEVMNLNFRGIKQLNDIYGQAFVDGLIGTFKQDIITRFDRHSAITTLSYSRLVRNEYKNLTFSFPKGSNPLGILFDGKNK